MSLFDALDSTVADVFNQMESEMMADFNNDLADYNINKNRPSITALPFRSVPVKNIESLKKANTGFFGLKLFGAGRKDQFIASVEKGKTTCTEVLVLAGSSRIVDRSEEVPGNVTYKPFYKVADLNGVVIREDVPVLDDNYVLTLTYSTESAAKGTGCADTVDPNGYLHAYVLHYYLKDDQFYVLLSKEQFEDMALIGDDLGHYWHFVEDGVGYTW